MKKSSILLALSLLFTVAIVTSCDTSSGKNEYGTKSFTVNFDSKGGTEIEPQTVMYGETISEPVDLNNSDMIFNGWYSDDTLQNRWDFAGNVVTANMILYAGWTAFTDQESFVLVIDSDSGTYTIDPGTTDPSGHVYIPAYYMGVPVTAISAGAFRNCTALTGITIPSTVTEIENHAFNGCTSLNNVKLPQELETMGSWVFSGCTALDSIVIPGSLVSIGNPRI